jgi:EAL domain-containing protein (putative c-di-GMP-specific phosphodiesterase class I)
VIAVVTYEKEAQAIVKATIDLARSFGLEVAADGIENESQWRWLRNHGCELGQGAFLGDFLPGPQLFERLVDQH